MIAKIVLGIMTVSVVLRMAGAGRADGPAQRDSGPDEKHRAALDRHLAKIPRGNSGTVLPMSEDAVVHVLPSSRFFTVRYRDYPVKPPAPLKANNLFLVPSDGPVKHLDGPEALEAIFRPALGSVKTDLRAKEAVKAWLSLAKEFHQDGHLRFTIPDNTLKVASKDGQRIASGKAVVVEGGQGEIDATLTFDADGKLIKVKTTGGVHPEGVRPA